MRNIINFKFIKICLARHLIFLSLFFTCHTNIFLIVTTQHIFCKMLTKTVLITFKNYPLFFIKSLIAQNTNMTRSLIYLILKRLYTTKKWQFLFLGGVLLLFSRACFSLFLFLFCLSKITVFWYSDIWALTTLYFSFSGIPLLSIKISWTSYCTDLPNLS